MKALAVAKKFIKQEFPDCLTAFLGGSVIRGEASETSDLDIVVITDNTDKAFRESFYQFSWPIEVFVHTKKSYRKFFEQDKQRRQPSLPRMCAEGEILKDTNDLGDEIKEEAKTLLAVGPDAYSEQEKEDRRYYLTNLLDDLIGADSRAEEIFIVNQLSSEMVNFILISNGQWKGAGKWIPKSLYCWDEKLCNEFMTALEKFYQQQDKTEFSKLVERELKKYGGRLFAGYLRRD